MKRLLGLGAAASALVLALSGCANYSGDPSSSATAGDKPALIKEGTLTVCTHLSYPPFEFKDEKSNKIVGFDVDLMALIAKDLGVEHETVDIDFGQITSGAVFPAKQCDAGAAAMTITPERQQAALVSDPYFDATQALLVKKGSPITDLASLRGKTIAVQTDTTGKIYAEKNQAANGYTIKIFDDMPTTSNAVLSGAADATINDNGVLFDFAKNNPTTTVVKEFATGESYGINVGKDNPALLAVVNRVLTKAKEDGTYNDVYKKWFGVDAPK